MQKPKTKPQIEVSPADPVDLTPITDATRETGVPKSTIHRWIAARRLSSRTLDGVQCVSIAAVLEVRNLLAAARGRVGNPGASPGTGPGTGTGTGAEAGGRPGRSVPVLSAEDYGDLFELLEADVPTVRIVTEHGFTPDAVAHAREKWERAKETDKGRPDPVAALQPAIVELMTRVEAVEALLAALPEALRPVTQRLAALEKRIADVRAMLNMHQEFLAQRPGGQP